MKFDQYSMAFLQEMNAEPGWNSIREVDLQKILNDFIALEISPEETPVFGVIEALLFLLSKVKPAASEWVEEIITTHVDEGGVLDVVLGPTLLADPDGGVVLKLGNNLVPATLDLKGKKLQCGSLEGDIEILEESNDKTKKSWISLSFDGFFQELGINIRIPFSLLDAEGIKKQFVKNLMSAGNLPGICELLKVATTGGEWGSMDDLELGEYLILSIEERPIHKEYGRSWTFLVNGFGTYVSKGGRFEAALAANFPVYKKRLAKKLPLTLGISAKNKTPGGSIQVIAGFFTREPLPERLVAGNGQGQASLKSAAPPAQAALTPATEPAAIPVTATTVLESANLDDIPF